MLLKNKKTGEIVEFRYLQSDHVAPLVLTTYENDKPEMYCYNSLTELNSAWEDYEEPEMFYWIDYDGKICKAEIGTMDRTEIKQIGNYFETKEEAEKAIAKLKAIQRLKNYYLKFKLDFVKNKIDFTYRLDGTLHSSVDEQRIIFEDMNLLFGGEDE